MYAADDKWYVPPYHINGDEFINFLLDSLSWQRIGRTKAGVCKCVVQISILETACTDYQKSKS